MFAYGDGLRERIGFSPHLAVAKIGYGSWPSLEAAWSVTGAEKTTGRPASWTPASIRSRQSLWISPER
jgi:hypothetical protein